ncbi:hypothetical protein ACH5RR_024690 [Cinchona calisaya]|uniref:KIB1-4 beta-propeller domain-containing protein n=1 Tax=Cinchona calisaya TaxID=153742 RepID=A0ABD2YYI9_9GENT
MLLITKMLLPQKMKSASSSAAMIGRFTAAASYSSSASPVDDKIWLMLPSHEVKDPNPTKKTKDLEEPCKVGVHKWHESCFYDIGKKSFITSNQENNESNDQEVPKVVGSSHGYLASLKPSDCSLSLVKIPRKFYASPRLLSEEGYQLPGIDTLPAFKGKIFRQSDFNHKYGEYKVVGFASRGGDGDDEILETSREVSDYFVEKIVMSDPRSSGLPTVVMTTHSPQTKLSFCRGFDAQKWIHLDTNCCFSDIIYSNRDQKFYAIENSFKLEIEVWDLKDPGSPKKKILVPSFTSLSQFKKLHSYATSKMQPRLCRRYYLAESLGEILLIIRYFDFHVAEDGTCLNCLEDSKCELPYKTVDFDVFKIDPLGKKLHSMKCLGDQALFLGINHSFAVSAREIQGIEGNSIYFGDHYMLNHSHFRGEKNYAYGGHDFGIFNLEEKRVSSCYATQTMKLMHPPVWVAPTSYLVRDQNSNF